MSLILLRPTNKQKPESQVGELYWSLSTLAAITGAPEYNLKTYWFPIAAMIPATKKSHIAALATGATEVGSFEPINEYGDYAYFMYMYDITSPDPNRREVARQLGNIYAGDGNTYHGRGIIQLTGRANYRRYGQRFGIPLEDNPNLALDANVSAMVFSAFMADHNSFVLAEQNNWPAVRRSVNGGLNGYDKFINIVNQLSSV